MEQNDAFLVQIQMNSSLTLGLTTSVGNHWPDICLAIHVAMLAL